MPRKPRIAYPGYYHLISRGVERRDVFLHRYDFEAFLEILALVKKRYDVTVHAFCLMSNHYHLLLETHQENLPDAMRYLNSHYSAWFNKKYERSGHLWQGRYHSYYLYDDLHFWNVAKYIERNPVAANIVEDVEQYPYQSLYQWQNNTEFMALLEGSMIFDMQLKEYNTFISIAHDEKTLTSIYKSPKIIRHDDGTIEVKRRRLETFFEQDLAASRSRKIADAAAYGYSQTEIAHYLQISVTAVSKILKKNA